MLLYKQHIYQKHGPKSLVFQLQHFSLHLYTPNNKFRLKELLHVVAPRIYTLTSHETMNTSNPRLPASVLLYFKTAPAEDVPAA